VPDADANSERNVNEQYDRWQADRAAFVASLPQALLPYNQYRPPNSPTPLYQGSLQVDTSNGAFKLDGRIEILWQPSPQLYYSTAAELPLDVATSVIFEGVEADAFPADTTVVPEPPIGEWVAFSDPSWTGHLTRLDVGSGTAFSHVTFQLVNFIEYLGAWVVDDSVPYHGRVEMSGGGWRLTVDARPDLDAVKKVLNSTGGYAATHTGRLEREDGSTFSRDVAVEMLDGLYWFFSFVAGSPCGPFLPVGFDLHGHAAWSRWGVPTTTTWPPQGGWLDSHYPQAMADLFPGFVERWLDPYWKRVVYLGVGYYLDANVPRTVEKAIALGQIVLELLVYAVLVDGGHKSTSDVRNVSRGIGMLLDHYGIDHEVPEDFTELRLEAEREGWLTAPWAMTALRNEITHPKRDREERPFRAKIEAWKLVVWYVEMTLLATFNFNGVYGKRLGWPRWVGQVEPVPWADATIAVSADIEDRLPSWIKLLDELDDEVTALFLNRDTWKGMVKIIQSNPAIRPSHVFQVLATTYAASQAVAVRRLADPGRGQRVVSFVALLTSLKAAAGLITRDWWLSEVDDPIERWMIAKGFDEQFAGKAVTHLDAAIVQADLDELAHRVRVIRKYVDRNLAHKDPKPTKVIPTLADLDQAIDYIGDLFRKYYLLLKHGDRHPIGPVFAYDWVAPFRVAWLTDKSTSSE
jgi:hypothetical protein